MKGQPRKHSMLEALINVAIGYGVALAAQLVIFPAFGIHVPLRTNVMIGAAFTGVSIVRQYIIRRAFNWYHTRGL